MKKAIIYLVALLIAMVFGALSFGGIDIEKVFQIVPEIVEFLNNGL